MTCVQEDQIAAIPDEGKWGEIVAIPRRVVPTHGVRDLRDRGSAWRNSRMRRGARRSRESGEGHLRTVKDPLITATARGEADLLVTEDRTSATGLGKMD